MWNAVEKSLPKKEDNKCRVSGDVSVMLENGRIVEGCFCDTVTGKFFTFNGYPIQERVVAWKN